MNVLIDSDVFIDFVRESPGVVAYINDLAPTGIAISSITYLEVFDGLLYDPPETIAAFRSKVTRFPVIPVDADIAERAARLRNHLRRSGKNPRSRSLDLIIAATALANGLTLVTRNNRHFHDVPGLAYRDDAPAD